MGGELGEHPVDVGFHRAREEAQFAADLGVGESFPRWRGTLRALVARASPNAVQHWHVHVHGDDFGIGLVDEHNGFVFVCGFHDGTVGDAEYECVFLKLVPGADVRVS